MKTKAKLRRPALGLVKTGSFRFEGRVIDVLMNTKTAQLVFEENGVRVEDPALQDQMMKTLLEVNKASGK